MRRRWVIVAVVALVCGLAATLLAVAVDDDRPGSRGGADAADDHRPNVVLITTDDQALMELRWMPRTRRVLQQAGVDFTEGIAPHPLCCPSRAQMLTGQYAQNNGVRSNGGPHGGFTSLERPGDTVASWLQGSGYHTGLVGKYLNGYRAEHGRQRGWEYWNPTVRGYTDAYDYVMFDDGDGSEETVEVHSHDVHQTDLVTDRTVELVDRWAGPGAPFFIWSSYMAPHGTCAGNATKDCSGPPFPPERYAAAYRGARLPSLDKPSFNEADMRDKPVWMRGQAPRSATALQHLFRQRIRSLAAVDEGIAELVAALEAKDELDHTYLIFTSDNGYLLGEHRFEEKILGFQESVRVPFLIRGPGIPAGVRRSQIASTIDLAPTIAAIAGVEPGRTVDGVNLLPLATHDAPLRRTALIQAGPRQPMGTREWTFRGVYTERYTLMRWTKTGFVELYDRQRDPFELGNVAGDRRYAAVRAELLRRLAALETCAGEACSRDFGPVPAPAVRR